jgi:hypothetical protein
VGPLLSFRRGEENVALFGVEFDDPVLSLGGGEAGSTLMTPDGVAVLGEKESGIGMHVLGEWPVLRFSKEQSQSQITMGLLGGPEPDGFAANLCAVCAPASSEATPTGRRGVLVIAATAASASEPREPEE